MADLRAFRVVKFLSHLSGDEGLVSMTRDTSLFLSHLSGDEDARQIIASANDVSKSPER